MTFVSRHKPLPYVERYAAGSPRRAAVERARRLGVPTQRVEPWRYTSLNPLLETDFEPSTSAPRVDPALVRRLTIPNSHRLAFADGWAVAEAGTDLPPGVSLRIDKDFGSASGLADDHPFVAINAAFATGGLVLTIRAGVRVERPIHLLFLGGGNGKARAFHPRFALRLEPGAKASVIEHHAARGDGAYWSNPVGSIVLGAGARFHHCKLIEDGAAAIHIAVTAVEVGAGAAYDSAVVTTGGALARNELGVTLAGEGAACRLDGLYLARGRQHIDNTTEIVHAHPKTTSVETYKGVLDDKARGVFQGRIIVRPQAQKSDGRQTNRTLLLSDQAEIDTRPELEILADDVKCGHGAAAGEIDETALFYLRARGIGADEARRMLTEAFAAEVIDGIEDKVAAALLRERLAAWLAAPGAHA
jgi:Fe-S cluster assembly protein SufD